jgi:hypothetical protein
MPRMDDILSIILPDDEVPAAGTAPSAEEKQAAREHNAALPAGTVQPAGAPWCGTLELGPVELRLEQHRNARLRESLAKRSRPPQAKDPSRR